MHPGVLFLTPKEEASKQGDLGWLMVIVSGHLPSEAWVPDQSLVL